MPKRSSTKRAPQDEAQLAKSIVDELTADEQDEPAPQKNPNAVALGRLGGQKGGPARAAKLSKKKRSAIAKKAAQARWGKPSDK
ncbi:MAG: hypothetical protein DMF64_07460 [Acidobacteria bacterium]|nr:MAG: hypothetical protein DMF64_07460 [Acidobacteriota bacterium]